MLSVRTQNLGVIGWPVAHSLSPVMQNAALAAAGLHYSYIAMPVEPAALGQAAAGLKALGFRGFNVTIPHKVNIIEFLDEIDDDARMIGAVNTVLCEDGKLYGFNTDADGFLAPFDDFGDRGLENVTVLGAGGAAKAIFAALIKKKAGSVSVGVRDVTKGRAAVALFQKYVDIRAYDWQDEAFSDAISKAELIVNTTPLGMTPHTFDMPPVDFDIVRSDAIFYDIIYTPSRTKLLQEAERRGHLVVGGAGMLVGQGAAAFEIWTGRRADRIVMERALKAALMGRDA